MEVEFTVIIKGSWLENGKRITAAGIQKELREAVKERFEFLAKSAKVKRIKQTA